MPLQPIGLFDSGEGGLTVAKELDRLLPGYPLLYACDTAHFPYGPRSLAEVREFFLRFLDFFAEQGCRLVVVACNTATAAAVLGGEAARHSPIPVIGVVEPGARAGARATRTGRVGVVATEATCKAGVYLDALARERSDLQVVQQPCPILVTMAEHGRINGRRTRAEVARCLEPLLAAGIDTLILGCTHFPHMVTIITDVVGPNVTLVDPGRETAREVAAQVAAVGEAGGAAVGETAGAAGGAAGGAAAEVPGERPAQRRFFCTGDPARFQRVARQLWPGAIAGVEHLPLWG